MEDHLSGHYSDKRAESGSLLVAESAGSTACYGQPGRPGNRAAAPREHERRNVVEYLNVAKAS